MNDKLIKYIRAGVNSAINHSPLVNSKVMFNGIVIGHVSVLPILGDNKYIAAYRDDNDGYKGKAVIFTYKNDKLKFNTPIVFNNGDTEEVSLMYDIDSEKVYIAYRDESDLGLGKVAPGYIKNGRLRFKKPVVFNEGYTNSISGVFNKKVKKLVIGFADANDNNFGKIVIGSLNEDNIKFGIKHVFNEQNTYAINLTYDSVDDLVGLAFKNWD